MIAMFDQSSLKETALKCADHIVDSKKNGSYASEPFQHIIIDNFLPEVMAKNAMHAFPNLQSDMWDHSNDAGIEIKSRSSWKSEFDIPEQISHVVRICNSSMILLAMSKIFEIPKLMPDPYFSGGGLNVSENGGCLDVHVDGNYHDASGLNRRINLIIYLNPGWSPEWGGEFGLYTDSGKKLVRKIAPLYNRCIIFDTHDDSYHGIPTEISFPIGQPRRSIILYYYTAEKRPSYQIKIDKPHSALWRSKGYLDKRGNKTRDFS